MQVPPWVVGGQELGGCVVDVWRRGRRVENYVAVGLGVLSCEGVVGLDAEDLLRAAV